MPIYSGYPESGYKDWDDSSSTQISITAWTTTDVDTNPTATQGAYVCLNTSAVTTGGTITAATLDWYSLNDSRLCWISMYLWDGVGYNVLVWDKVGRTANAYATTALTTSAQLACINASGGNQTAFNISIAPTVANTTKSVVLRAFENAAGMTGATRIGIRYNDPVVASSQRRRIFNIG
jgi:hypothetical protein